MKLFTITATPVRNRAEQFEANLSQDEMDAINTKEVNRYPQVVASVLQHVGFDGFTLYKVDGYWQGVPEVSFKIELAVDSNPERVYDVARRLRAMYHQDGVMLTLPNNTVKFIED